MIRSGELQGQWFSLPKVGRTAIPRPIHLIASATSLRIGQHFRLDSLLRSYFQKLAHLSPLHRFKEGFNILPLSNHTSTCFSFYNGRETSNDFTNEEMPNSKMSSKNFFSGRQWTNVLLALNIIVYMAQVATQNDLLLWGAKINRLIDKGQLWRLVTSSVLHVNVGHLLVGSLAVFVLRHRDLVGGGREDLKKIAYVIILNMAIGQLSKGIDNWGHLGGLLGGAATSWLLGPAWKYECSSTDGRRVFADKAPIFYLINRKTRS